MLIARGITIIDVHVRKRNRRKIHCVYSKRNHRKIHCVYSKRNHRKIHCVYSKRNHNNRCTCKKAESQEKFIVFIARGITGKFIVFIARGITIINVHVRKRNRRKNSLYL